MLGPSVCHLALVTDCHAALAQDDRLAETTAAALTAKALAQVFRLPQTQGGTSAFSPGTRNPFGVLPFALALPAGWEAAAVVIVFQSLVQLFGITFFPWWVPRSSAEDGREQRHADVHRPARLGEVAVGG